MRTRAECTVGNCKNVRHVVAQKVDGLYKGTVMQFCTKHWLRYGEQMGAAGFKVAEGPRPPSADVLPNGQKAGRPRS